MNWVQIGLLDDLANGRLRRDHILILVEFGNSVCKDARSFSPVNSAQIKVKSLNFLLIK